jgi:hypothetical protein
MDLLGPHVPGSDLLDQIEACVSAIVPHQLLESLIEVTYPLAVEFQEEFVRVAITVI